MEIWKPVAGYENIYEVSNFGRVKSLYRGERILKSEHCASGYLRVSLHCDCKAKRFFVHRLVAQAFIPNPDNKPEVNHRNGVKTDNRIENLEWVTSSENKRHAADTGLTAQGETVYNSKITNEQARYIRDNPNKLTTLKLAEMFGVSHKVIGLIQLGKSYKTSGGKIRKDRLPDPRRVSDEIRVEIRRLFIKGDKKFGARALAHRFGVDPKTILNIVKETHA